MSTSNSLPNVRLDSLDAWLSWQESQHVVDVELGLERCRWVADRMDMKRLAPIVVTVAGTNGKGSSVAMLESILRQAGYRVGTYTSPHLCVYNERIRIDGTPVSDQEICAAFAQVEFARAGTPLTYFEFGTLAALSLFSEAMLDIVILEVGLGGRLDAVNIIDADVALIATIGIDHTEFLGDTRELIALEKAGIMRKGKPAVCSDIDVASSIKRFAHELPTQLEILGNSYRYSDDGEYWSWWSGDTRRVELPKPSLIGDYQLGNAAGVLMVLEVLKDRMPVTDVEVARGLRHIDLPGRFQRVSGEVETILDVGHNAQAVDAFVRTLINLEPRRTHVLLGMLDMKDHQSVIRLLAPIAHTWHLTSVISRKGASSDDLYDALKLVVGRSAVACTYDSVASGYRSIAATASPGDRIVALGSFLVVSEVLACLKRLGKGLKS